ncbi:MAG: SUMF1/EgtB/PvdO family nonheme iron enzyme, partial [Verrucomicrobia bacterium]|nr:SUMF1/EgtB/PvdO family nonheme iron enzyme [Verrucomicrobiota bacterium]
ADADVRRRANLAALRDTPAKAGLVDAFIAARLLTADGPTVSLAHEALLRKWDRVADWVRDNRAFLRIRSRVEQALKRWSDAGNRPDLLLPEGLDLEEASALLKDAPLLLAGSEYEPVRGFITTSQEYHEKRRRRVEATRRTVTFFLVVLTLGASAGAIFGYIQAKAAGKQRDTAFYNDGQGALLRAQVAKQEGNRFPDQFFHLGRAIGFDGFGRTEDSGPGDFLDQARSLLGIGAPADPYPVLITTQRDKPLHDRIRGDIATLPSYLPVWTSGPGTGAAVTGADFSPDGRFLVAGFADGSVRRWDFSKTEVNATVLQPAGGGAVGTVRFRPDGKALAVAAPSGVILWREAGSETLIPGATTAFAWAPDGARLAAGFADGAIRTMDVEPGTDKNVHAAPGKPVTALAFSPDGRTLAAGSADGSLRLLDAVTGQERSVLISADTVPVTSIAFHPASAWLAAANAEGWVRFWSVDGSEISHPQSSGWGMDPEAKIKLKGADLAFSPNGRRLAIGTNDGKGGFAKLWGVEDPAKVRELATLTHHAPTSPVIAFAPDGANLVTATDDGTLVLWDVRALPWLEADGKLDLAVYFQDGLYRFDAQEPVIGPAPSVLRNLRPDSLPGLWLAGGDSGALFARLVKSGNLGSAAVLLERLPAGHTGREELAEALLAGAEEAAKGYQWQLAGERLDRLGALGGLSSQMTAKVNGLSARRPGQEGQSFGNSLEKMEMIWCPKGKFTMGQVGGDSDETPHEVTLTRGFWLAKHEVTHAQWQAVMGNQPWNFTESGPDAPVENVSWEDAMAFCRKLTERERAAGALPVGWEYSLPTEAQWEYACRAGTTTVYSFGDEEARLGDYAWYDENSEDKTHPVGLKKPNAWGLHDMQGNVWEWCFDWNDDYPTGAVTDPFGPKEGVGRVSRGGSWSFSASNCRAADRAGLVPAVRIDDLGFRPACVPSR